MGISLASLGRKTAASLRHVRHIGTISEDLGRILAPTWAFLEHLGHILAPCWAHLGASWSPSWLQDWPSWSRDGAKLPNLAPRGASDGHLRTQDSQLEPILGSSCQLFRILDAKSQITENIEKHVFLKLFDLLGRLGAHLGAKIGQVGTKKALS